MGVKITVVTNLVKIHAATCPPGALGHSNFRLSLSIPLFNRGRLSGSLQIFAYNASTLLWYTSAG